jgi:hypothetical protein
MKNNLSQPITYEEVVAGTPTSKAYYVCTLEEGYKAGIPAEILGVVIYTPEGFSPRPGFHIQYPDGSRNYAAMHDVDANGKGQFFEIVSEEQVRAGYTPTLVEG